MSRYLLFGRDPAREHASTPKHPQKPAWVEAEPSQINEALDRALGQPSGGWAVIDATKRIIKTPRSIRIAGRTLVVWRGLDGTRAAPHRCPHMGASLCEGKVDRAGHIVCPWHGLTLGDRPRADWAPLETHDDGVLSWVQMRELLAPGESPSERPIITPRPSRYIAGVIRREARCEPRDIIANRLDPWHGVHFHPHSFLRLDTLEQDLTQITVRVVYKVLGPLAMQVDARFHCPDPRTIVMTIIAGDGVGSVVETHATPIDDTHTRVIEATLATSDRVLFPLFMRARRLIQPVIERRADRLWVEDCDYAEQTFALRTEQEPSVPER